MFGIGWSEYVLIGAVALIVIGPKELPAVLRAVGQWTTKVRRMAAEFQSQFQEAMREAEMADLKKEVDSLTSGFNTLPDPETAKWDPETVARMNEETRKSAETDSALAVFAEGAPVPTVAPASTAAPASDAALVSAGSDVPERGLDVQAPEVGAHPLDASPEPAVSAEPTAMAAVSATPAQTLAAGVPAAAPAPSASSAATGAAGVAGAGAQAAETGALRADRSDSTPAADAAPVAEESSRV
jgi:sec-independent protein translocase protein TatB